MKRSKFLSFFALPFFSRAKAEEGMEDFDAAWADFKAGRVVDMDTAMNEPYPCKGHHVPANGEEWPYLYYSTPCGQCNPGTGTGTTWIQTNHE